jgi:S1-C subfamily serine protease
LVPNWCIQRTLKIKTRGRDAGTSFTIDLHGQQWLVTADHVVSGVSPGEVTVVMQTGAEVGGLIPVPAVNPSGDVAVFDLNGRRLTADLPLAPATPETFGLSQDVYFLGFPFGLQMQGIGEIYPFVKKAIISAWDYTHGIDLFFLDGMNNPGFSGGPVVFSRLGTQGQDWRVLGVVHGYHPDSIPVLLNPGIVLGTVRANAGIVLGYGIRHAVEAIDAYVSR